MKKNLLLACCILVTITTIQAQKIINFPAYRSTNRSNLKIEQVEITDTATILRMKINYEPNKFWSISPDSYILVDGNPAHLMIKGADGIELGERMYTKNGISLFSLRFPAIDSTAKTIEFIESDCAACFKISGVDLTGRTVQQLYESNDYQAVRALDDHSSMVSESSDKPSKSTAIYDGSSYNLMFSWKKKANNPHWAGMGMAIANFDGMSDTGADLSVSTSYSFVVNPVDYCVPLSHHWLLVSGTGFDWTRYHFKGNMGLEEVNGITQFVPAPEGTTYKSSKLLTYYITIPLFLEYQTKIPKGKTLFISGGVVGYIKCYSKSQVDVNVDGGVQKINKGRDLNILPVNGRAMLQFGMSDVSFYAYYSPFSLFEKDKGPDIKPVGIGVVIDF